MLYEPAHAPTYALRDVCVGFKPPECLYMMQRMTKNKAKYKCDDDREVSIQTCKEISIIGDRSKGPPASMPQIDLLLDHPPERCGCKGDGNNRQDPSARSVTRRDAAQLVESLFIRPGIRVACTSAAGIVGYGVGGVQDEQRREGPKHIHLLACA